MKLDADSRRPEHPDGVASTKLGKGMRAMKFLITGAGVDKGQIHDVTVLAKKFNGVWVKKGTSVGFVCYSDIRILHMTEQERAMSVYMKPGYPGKED